MCKECFCADIDSVQKMRNTGFMGSSEYNRALAAAQTALEQAGAAEIDLGTVEQLRVANEEIAIALNEAMAELVVAGASVRQVAAAAGMAPNSVRPRLASSQTLGEYAADGVVDAMGVAAARLESRAPMRFVRRRTNQEEK